MAKRSGVLIGTAGVYHVAAQLAARDYHAAVTFGNAPSIDILVGLSDGGATLSLQVKTSRSALRTRGRGNSKQPYEYQWDVGEKSAKLNHPDLFFVFVDLKLGRGELPDFWVVPSQFVFSTFDNSYFKSGVKRRWRWHRKIEEIEQYKNNWDILRNHLETSAHNRE